MNLVVVDRNAQPEGWMYYTQPGIISEPMGNGQSLSLTAGDANHCDNMSLLRIVRGLFDKVGGTKEKVNLLIVCHATTDELLIRLTDKSKAELTPKNLQLLTFWGEQLNDNKLRAQSLGISREDLEEILDYTAILREDQNIGHLAIRACRLGQNFEAIQQFIELFGCQSISVPIQKDAYSAFLCKGFFKPSEIDAAIARLKSVLGNDAPQVFEKVIAGKTQRLLWYIERREHSRFKLYTLPESLEVYQAFLNERIHVASMRSRAALNQPAYFHALSDGERKFFFQPDPKFTNNLKYYDPSAKPAVITPAVAEQRKGVVVRAREKWQHRRRWFSN